MNVRDYLDTVLDVLINISAFVAATLILFVLASVGADVIMRYFAGRPMSWVLEVTEYAMVFITFLGAAWLLRKDGHVRMDIATNAIPGKVRLYFDFVTSLIGAGICLVLSIVGLKIVAESFVKGIHETSVLEPPSYILYSVIPAGCLLMFLQFLRMAARTFHKKNEI